MAEFFFNLLAESVLAGVFMSSNMTSSKKIKIYHAIFRTSLYLSMTVFFFLTFFVSTATLERCIYLIIGFIFFVAMLKTNWTSYKRHQEYIDLIQKKDRRRETQNMPF